MPKPREDAFSHGSWRTICMKTLWRHKGSITLIFFISSLAMYIYLGTTVHQNQNQGVKLSELKKYEAELIEELRQLKMSEKINEQFLEKEKERKTKQLIFGDRHIEYDPVFDSLEDETHVHKILSDNSTKINAKNNGNFVNKGFFRRQQTFPKNGYRNNISSTSDKTWNNYYENTYRVGHCLVYNISTEPKWDFKCTKLQSRPSIPICPYPSKDDLFISKQIWEEGDWEPHIVKEVQKTLYSDPEFGFIDIGANIGVYGLLAATMGHKVVAVEPYQNHIHHLHNAAKHGNVAHKIVMVQNGISDKRTFVKISESKNNQGATQFDLETKSCDHNCPPGYVPTIYMDDLVDVIDFKKAVMKIDIEGHEHRAFKHASKLLEKVYIPYIFMEWVVLRRYYGAEIDQSEDKTLVFELIDYLYAKGYKAYSVTSGKMMDPQYWYGWHHDVIWKHELSNFI